MVPFESRWRRGIPRQVPYARHRPPLNARWRSVGQHTQSATAGGRGRGGKGGVLKFEARLPKGSSLAKRPRGASPAAPALRILAMTAEQDAARQPSSR